MDTKDMPTVSKWWGPAMSALEAWRDLHQGCGAYRAGYANQITYAKAQSRVQPNGSDSKDAARYRWLRDNNVGPSQIDRVCDDCNPPYFTLKSGTDLDAAIDAAIDSAMKGGA